MSEVDEMLDAGCDEAVGLGEIMTKQELAEVIQAVALSEADAVNVGNIALHLGCRSDLSAAEGDEFLGELAKTSGISKPALREDRKRGQQLRKERDAQRSARKPDDMSDDVLAALREWNRQFAIVTAGGKVRVLEEPDNAGVMPKLYELDAFRTLKAPVKVTLVERSGETRQEPLSKLWLEWSERRTYEGGIIFEPKGGRESEYNLWRKFPIVGRQGDWSLLRGHLLDNICQGNRDYFDWTMTWLSQIFQQPGDKLGSALVVVGEKGTGKSKLFEWVSEAMGNLAIKIAQRSHLVGNFNAHQSGILLMVAEEALWAGDPAAGGVLKDMITSPRQMVERKGVDPVEVSSYVRVAMVSNSDWVVPAGFDDERRYMVLRCGKGRQKDRKFFAAVDAQMRTGGLEAMVSEFMNWTPPGNDWSVLRDPPKTPWLREQSDEGTTLGERFFLRMVGDGHHQCRKEHKLDEPDLLSLHDVGEEEVAVVNGARMIEDGGAWWVLWPIKKLRHHYQEFTGEKARNAKTGRAPGDRRMMQYAERLLGATSTKADGTPWLTKELGRCVAVPMRAVIMDDLDARGIPFDRTD